MEPFTLTKAAKLLVDEGAAWVELEAMRWPNGAICPNCHETDRVTYLAPKNGPRMTRSGTISHRRVWKCNACRKQFTALVGTIFEDSKIPVGKWLMAVYLMSAGKNGVSAHELHRDLGITYKTAWFMCHRLRLAMSISPLAPKWSGVIVADETWIGGNPTNRHTGTRRHAVKTPKAVQVIPGQNLMTDKTPVLALINKETGEVRSSVVANTQTHTLRKVIADHVDMTTSALETDSSRSYPPIGAEFAVHHTVDHSIGQYVNLNNSASTNRAEGYFSQLKRSIDGTHHHISVEHLSRYTSEFDFRYSTCKVSDTERAVRMVGQAANKRLTYDRLTGRGVRPPVSGRRPTPQA